MDITIIKTTSHGYYNYYILLQKGALTHWSPLISNGSLFEASRSWKTAMLSMALHVRVALT